MPNQAMTLATVGQVLRQVEAREGAVVAHKLAKAFDYGALTELARCWLHDPDRTENDPNRHIPTRYLMLLGMEGPEVLDFQRALWALGHGIRKDGRFGEQTLQAFTRYLASRDRGDRIERSAG